MAWGATPSNVGSCWEAMRPERCTPRAANRRFAQTTRDFWSARRRTRALRRDQLRTRWGSCNCCKVRDRDREARELRSVAPLLVDGALVGPVTLVRNGARTIGATDIELVRPHVGAQLSVVTRLDGSASVPVGHWGLSRKAELALIELAQPIESGHDVSPLDLGA